MREEGLPTMCIADDCNNDRGGRSRYCWKHQWRIKKHGDPNKFCSEEDRIAAIRESDVGRPRIGNDVGYEAVHYRLPRDRGPASAHPCMNCGERSLDWALVHNRDIALVSNRNRQYSTDLLDYEPMCRSCHRTMDNEYARTAE